MTAMLELLPERDEKARPALVAAGASQQALPDWLKAQAVNVARHAAALRPFAREEFGATAAAPTEGHLQAANELLSRLRGGLIAMARQVGGAATAAQADPSPAKLTRLVTVKDKAHQWVQAVEKIWDFYFELFGQRQSRFGDWLLSCDRIALDCYQYTYLGLGLAKSIPAPPPFSYMRTGFSPATFRRSVPLQRLGRQRNPFPLIELPYHRLTNPWTLGAILHEVSHNLQNDLGLEDVIPRAMEQRLLAAGMPRFVAVSWRNWNRELFADVCGLLFGGPAVIESLMDVVGRSRENTMTFSEGAPHPTPYFRVFISCELLRRMGFPEAAAEYRRTWSRLFPSPKAASIPKVMLETFDQANALIVDTVCYRKFPQLGDRSLAQVIRFEPKEQVMIEEAGRRLAAGVDPGVVPERFLIGAARIAFNRKLARPGAIAKNFYCELARR
jgi:hypothetical protein